MGKKLLVDGYCDISKFLQRTMTRTEIKQKLQRVNSRLLPLYSGAAPKNFSDMENSLRSLLDNSETDYMPTEFESFCLVDFIFKSHKNQQARKEYIRKVVDKYNTQKEYDGPLAFSNSVIFFSEKVDLHLFKTISQFNDKLKSIEAESKLENTKMFFRGHSDINYQLLPSIVRKDEWLINERKMYFELIINCPNYFKETTTSLDRLVLMQHYGLPTRLLDITLNPLVALYFACEGDKPLGEVVLLAVPKTEIKYPQSDIVTILSSLPMCTYEDQLALYKLSNEKRSDTDNFNGTEQVNKLVHTIRSERIAFDPKIRPEDIQKNVVVMPEKSNDRIVKQDGAFILCGLNGNDTEPSDAVHNETSGAEVVRENSLENLRVYNNDHKKQLLICTDKKSLMEELDRFAINKAKLFPEVDDVADYIKNHITNL